MRVAMAALALGAVAPAGGLRSCASQAPATVRLAFADGSEASGGGVRVGCFSPEVADHADPVADTAPLPADGRVSYPEPCSFVAFRRVGQLWDRSAPVALRPGDEGVTAAFLPDRGAGVGIAFRHDPWRREAVVTAVAPGGPADGVLARGDRLLAVDGAPAGRSRWTLAEQVMGAPGTTVTLTVLREGAGATDRTLTRARVDP
jgi:hypothetical protein